MTAMVDPLRGMASETEEHAEKAEEVPSAFLVFDFGGWLAVSAASAAVSATATASAVVAAATTTAAGG
jgi:hypothetical protein